MGEIDRELERRDDATAKGMAIDKIAARVKALEAERDELRARIAEARSTASGVTLRSAALDRYGRDVAELANRVGRDVDDDTEAIEQLVAALRRLVVEIVVHPPANSEELTVEMA